MPSALRASRSLIPILSGATPRKVTLFSELARALSAEGGVLFASAFTPLAPCESIAREVVSTRAESRRAPDSAVQPASRAAVMKPLPIMILR